MNVDVTRKHRKGTIERTFASAGDVVAAIGLFVEDGDGPNDDEGLMTFRIVGATWDTLDSLQAAFENLMTTGAFSDKSTVDISNCTQAEKMSNLSAFAAALVYNPITEDETVTA